MNARPHPNPLPQEREKCVPLRAILLARTLCVTLFLPAVFVLAVRADDALTDLMSPVVSYQYYETVGQPGSTLVSPVASYQYFDSLGDLVSWRSDTAPTVSYFYNWGGGGPPIALRGQVVDSSGQPVQGAQVAASVFGPPQVQAETAVDGTFELPNLPPAIYELSASKQDFVPSERVFRLGSDTAWQPFQLVKFPALPETEVAGSTPAVAADLLDPLRGAKLRAFGADAFAGDASSASPFWITVVLTHGWNASADSTDDAWPKAMASALRAKLGSQVNLLAWDWHQAASTLAIPPFDRTPAQGLALGMELRRLLGAGYTMPIHFIGHSLGTLVNARAADYLHGAKVGQLEPVSPGWSADSTSVTLLDDAEIAGIQGKAVVYAAWTASQASADELFRQGLINMAATVSVQPVPEHAGWIDSYISAVGFHHDKAVNVCLQKATSLFSAEDWLGSATQMHGYAVDWYKDSIANPSASAMGFVNSYERESLLVSQPAFPPSYEPGTVFRQDPAAGNDLAVIPWDCDGCVECNAPALSLIHSDLANGGTVVWPTSPNKVVQDGTITLEWVVKKGKALSDGFQWISEQIGEAKDSVIDLFNTPSLRINMTTGLPASLNGGRVSLHDGEQTATNTPAYVWLPVFVPTGAVAMVFDFSVVGDPKEDAMSFGINGTNQFSFQGKFLNAGEMATSSPIDVTPYAGTTNEFFFGVVGGTSTNCTVTVEGLRFYSFTVPTLSIADAAGVMLLSWPTTAVNYSLETTPSLSPSAWTAVTNPPTILANQYVLTNVWSDQTRFFRLRQE